MMNSAENRWAEVQDFPWKDYHPPQISIIIHYHPYHPLSSSPPLWCQRSLISLQVRSVRRCKGEETNIRLLSAGQHSGNDIKDAPHLFSRVERLFSDHVFLENIQQLQCSSFTLQLGIFSQSQSRSLECNKWNAKNGEFGYFSANFTKKYIYFFYNFA